MKITNKYNLPQAFVDAIRHHDHKAADYSATTLQKSPRQVWLERRHADELEQDAADRVWALFGTMAHAYLEKFQPANALTEEYLTLPITLDDGRVVVVSGTADLYRDGCITDYKTTSVWGVL